MSTLNLMDRLDCAHCGGLGICKADDKASCGTCLKKAKVKSDHKVVRCDICDGVGKIEPKTERLIRRTPFIIVAIVLVTFYLYVGFNIDNPENFGQIFPLVGSLTTMIVTFYFAKK